MKKWQLLFLVFVMCLTAGMALADVNLDETVFPDSGFRSYLDDYDVNADSVLSDAEIAEIKEIKQDYYTISSCEGIQYLTALEVLSVRSHKSPTLDLSMNPTLREVNVTYSPNLTSLILGDNSALKVLRCNNNSLTDLDVSGCPNLEEILCSSNSLSELNLAGMTKLDRLECTSCATLQNVDLSGCTALTTLSLPVTSNPTDVPFALNLSGCTALVYVRENMSLSTLNLIGCTSVETIAFNQSEITSIDAHGCTALKSIKCYSDNSLVTLNASGCTALENINCNNDNSLTTLNVSGCTALTTISCGNSALTELDLHGCAAFSVIYANGTPLTLINLTGCTQIINKLKEGTFVSGNITGSNAVIKLFDGKLETIIDQNHFPDTVFLSTVQGFDKNKDGLLDDRDVILSKSINYWQSNEGVESLKGIQYLPYLTSLTCRNQSLESIDLSKNTRLEYLNLQHNRLTELDVSKNTKLNTLNCSENRLTRLDLRKNPMLTSLYCSDNQISDLRMGNHPELLSISASKNELTSFNTNKMKKLTTLYLSENELTKLTVSASTKLEKLECYKNNLVNLDISKQTSLQTLLCYNNKLKTLNLSKNKKLKKLSCFGNALTALDVSKNTKLEDLRCYSNYLVKLDISKCSNLIYLVNHADRKNMGRIAHYDLRSQDLYLYLDASVTIKAGSNIIDPTEEPVIEGEYSDTTGTYMVSRDKTAVFTAPAKASATSITIPDTIKVMNIKVKVVGIADNACKGMKKLAKLDIGQNVASIGANAFQGCAKLKAITVRTKHLTENNIGASAFKGIQKKATVTCPKGLAKTYQKIFVKKGMAKTVKFK